MVYDRFKKKQRSSVEEGAMFLLHLKGTISMLSRLDIADYYRSNTSKEDLPLVHPVLIL